MSSMTRRGTSLFESDTLEFEFDTFESNTVEFDFGTFESDTF